MFCPGCGANQSEQLKFCKSCGINLNSVRQAVATGESPGKFDWSKTWVAEMFLTEQEQTRRQEEIDRQRGITPVLKSEIKRYNEIKGGVITASIGVGVMLFLYVFFQGLIASGDIPHDAAEIIGRIWVAGAIPLIIGLGLIVNGVVVSKRLVEISKRELGGKQPQRALDTGARVPQADNSLPSANWTEPASPRFGVTENTTRELRE
ncbi:MAG TPA: hypothetical protein VJX67_09960 [Blastocatellia bacterium]|nr:hypothetical protein [Blastocatellia bacterium]